MRRVGRPTYLLTPQPKVQSRTSRPALPLIPPTMPPEQIANVDEKTPMFQPEQPTELAPAYVLLASDERAHDQRIEARTAIWAAGVQASEAAEWLGASHDRVGRVIVTDRLTVPAHPEIYVIGDTALMLDITGKPVPGLAPAAKEAGRFTAKSIRLSLQGKKARPFSYRHYGNLATVGRNRAVIEFGRFHLKGSFAWILWGAAHIFFLIGFRNRVVVALDWLWAYVWFRGSARLITNLERDSEIDVVLGEFGIAAAPKSMGGTAPTPSTRSRNKSSPRD